MHGCDARLDRFGDETEIDLREVNPRLRTFERYIGRCSLVGATALYNGQTLSFWDSTDWHAEFQYARDETIATLEETAWREREEQEQRRDDENSRIVERIHALLDVPEFLERCGTGKRPTQAVIASYVRTTIEDAARLPVRVLATANRWLYDLHFSDPSSVLERTRLSFIEMKQPFNVIIATATSGPNG
jgi:hypothetical protein